MYLISSPAAVVSSNVLRLPFRCYHQHPRRRLRNISRIIFCSPVISFSSLLLLFILFVRRIKRIRIRSFLLDLDARRTKASPLFAFSASLPLVLSRARVRAFSVPLPSFDLHRRLASTRAQRFSFCFSLSSAVVRCHLSLCSSFRLVVLYQAEDGSGHERATTLLLDSEVVTGAEVRRISIGFEPVTGGRPKTP